MDLSSNCSNMANSGGLIPRYRLTVSPTALRLTRRSSGAAPAHLRWERRGENAAGGSGHMLSWGRPLNSVPLGGIGCL